MRIAIWIGLVLLSSGCAQSQAPDGGNVETRYTVAPDLVQFPQGTPQETLESILNAIGKKRIDYILAQLSDPEFVDRRVAIYGGKFDALVEESSAKLKPDSPAVKQLWSFLKVGEWKIGEQSASAQLKDVPDRAVLMKKIGARWFMENTWKKSD